MKKQTIYFVALICMAFMGLSSCGGEDDPTPNNGGTGGGGSGSALMADFEADSVSFEQFYTVQFTDKSTGSPTKWEWNFGDGNTSDMQNPTHEYTTVGNFSVSLKITNASGDTKTESKSSFVTVAETGSTGLQYFYKMDGNLNESDNNLNGDGTFTSAKNRDNEDGKAIEFKNEVTSYGEVNGKLIPDILKPFSVSFYFNPALGNFTTSYNTLNLISNIGTSSQTNGGIDFTLDKASKRLNMKMKFVTVEVCNPCVGNPKPVRDITLMQFGSSALTADTWYHVVVTSEGKGGKVSFYIDGVSTANGNIANIEDPSNEESVTNGENWRLGSSTNSNGAYVNRYAGKMDNLRFYNLAISATQVKSLYDNE